MPALESGRQTVERPRPHSLVLFGCPMLSRKPRAFGSEGPACLLLAGYSPIPMVALPAW